MTPNRPLIPRRWHGIADYAYAPAVAAAPALVGFASHRVPARLCRVISAGVLASTVFTRAEWGIFKLVPYKTHLALDFAAGLGTAALPWLAGFAQNRRARNTFLVMGAISASAGLLSGLFSGSWEMPVLAPSARPQ